VLPRGGQEMSPAGKPRRGKVLRGPEGLAPGVKAPQKRAEGCAAGALPKWRTPPRAVAEKSVLNFALASGLCA